MWLSFIFWGVQIGDWKSFCHLPPTLKIEIVMFISESHLCRTGQHCVQWVLS